MIPDIMMGAPIHQSLKKKKLLPATHLVDSGYVEAKWIVQSANEEKVQIVGPPRPNNQWQALSKNGFALNDFLIDWETKRLCTGSAEV